MEKPKKAKLVQIENVAQRPQPATKADGGVEFEVQFNPESLKLTLSNVNSGGDQAQRSTQQFIGSYNAKMSVDLIFDTTEDGSDVRRLTKAVAYFVIAQEQPNSKDNKRIPPNVRFEWGSFVFSGVADNMSETLEYFAEDGTPLRATVALSLTHNDTVLMNDKRNPGPYDNLGIPTGTPATTPLAPARADDSIQRLAGRGRRSSDWKAIAAANDIDDPLRLPAGTLINMNPRETILSPP